MGFFNLTSKSKKKEKIDATKFEDYKESLPSNTKFLIKIFKDMTLSDFEEYPIWINCHLIDYEQPWYDETREDYFRPWFGYLPIIPGNMIFLVKSNLTCFDGTTYNGFITPTEEKPKDITKALGTIQPHIIHPSGKLVNFWYGLLKPSKEYLDKQYKLLEKTADKIFPIKFEVEKGLTKGIESGEIPGFCYSKYVGKKQKVKIIR